MKLLSTTAVTFIAATAAAKVNHIPYDCFSETQKAYGNEEGARVSDLDLMSGLDPVEH